MRILDRVQPLGLLVLRVVLGVIMTVHGKQKVFGGMAKHIAFVHSLGMPGSLAYFSAGAEFIGGLLLIIGLLTRLASLLVLINLLVAIFTVTLHRGLIGPGGTELPLALGTMAFALIWFGGGPISVDWLFGGKGGS